MITCKREANKCCNNMYRLKNVLNSFLNTFFNNLYKKKYINLIFLDLLAKKVTKQSNENKVKPRR